MSNIVKIKIAITDFKIILVAKAIMFELVFICMLFAWFATRMTIPMLLVLLIVFLYKLPDTLSLSVPTTQGSVLNQSFMLVAGTFGFPLIITMNRQLFFGKTFSYG